MKKAHLSRMLAPVCTALLLCLAGCQDKNNNGMPDSPATSAQVEKTVENAGESLEKTVENAVPKVENVAEKGVSLAADGVITGKVKAALYADKNISASGIDVTTKNKVVYLNGTVPNKTHHALASKIAAKAAGAGHPVKNGLKVAGKAPSKTR